MYICVCVCVKDTFNFQLSNIEFCVLKSSMDHT